MDTLQEKIKALLLLSEEDVPLFLKGDFKGLLARNKDATVRIGVAYSCVLIFLLLFLSVFLAFGAFGKIVLILLFFGGLGALIFLKKADLPQLMQYPVLSYCFIGIFGLMALTLFSGISSQGAFLSKLLMLLIIGGIGGCCYTFRQKARDFGLSVLHIVVVSLVAVSFLFSLQLTGIRFSTDQEILMTQRRSEMRRQRDAEQAQQNSASTKMCSSEEECRKMNMKKNSYYAQYEEVAQEICERAVAKEISGRFEWTVSAKDYKFNRYEVDVLKDEITLFGDNAQLINNKGERTKVMYACRYNTKKKTGKASVKPARP